VFKEEFGIKICFHSTLQDILGFYLMKVLILYYYYYTFLCNADGIFFQHCYRNI